MTQFEWYPQLDRGSC